MSFWNVNWRPLIDVEFDLKREIQKAIHMRGFTETTTSHKPLMQGMAT